MQDISPKLKDLYVNKPECVIHFPEWMLSGKKIDEYRSLSRLAIAEIAGRDSLAAAVKGVSEGLFTDLFTHWHCIPDSGFKLNFKTHFKEEVRW